jgi:hypothetical protein
MELVFISNPEAHVLLHHLQGPRPIPYDRPDTEGLPGYATTLLFSTSAYRMYTWGTVL